jgi:hypothetical protein
VIVLDEHLAGVGEGMGKVIRITASGVWFYQLHGERVRFAAWPSG